MISRRIPPFRTRRRDAAETRKARPLKVLHLIGDTDVGGAEAMLLNVASRLTPDEIESRVVSLLPVGSTGERLRAVGVDVRSLNLSRRWSAVPSAVVGFAHCIREYRPDLVQTWMYHADLLGGIAARLTGPCPVVWSVHHASLDRRDSRNTRVSARLCARLSRYVPARIAVVSESARRVHLQAGYDPRKLTVIPNGFDLRSFRPDAAARSRFRGELDIHEEDRLVGLIGRFHPHKDHETFVRAAGIIAAGDPRARFVCAGAGTDWSQARLSGWIDAHGLRDRFHLLGLRDDVPALMQSLDLAVCSSRTEAFPSVVGEAMASEVPCVVTDVGDCRRIVGDAGIVVPPANAAALAEAVLRALSLPGIMRAQWGRAARRRIIDNFTIEQTVAGYTRVWREVADQDGSRGRTASIRHEQAAEPIAA